MTKTNEALNLTNALKFKVTTKKLGKALEDIKRLGNTLVQDKKLSEGQFLAIKGELVKLNTLIARISDKTPEVTQETINDLEDRLNTYVKVSFDNIEFPETDLSPIKKLEDDLKKIRQELLTKLQGGGAPNRKIDINSSVISTRYTDIDIVAGANITLTKSDNDTTKTARLTIASSDLDKSAAWGSITGTLANQTDLQTELDLKAAQSTLANYPTTSTLTGNYTTTSNITGTYATSSNLSGAYITPSNITGTYATASNLSGTNDTFNLYPTSSNVSGTYATSSALLGQYITPSNITGTYATSSTVAGNATPPGGADTKLQFNNNGSFGGAGGLGWSDTTSTLSATGSILTTGEIVLANQTATLSGKDSGGNIRQMFQFNSLNNVIMGFGIQSTQSIRFSPGQGAKLTVLSEGNIGIGTVTPASKLDVRGNTFIGGNFGVGTSVFGTSAGSVLAIGLGTQPSTTPTGAIQLYAASVAAAQATIGFTTETSVTSSNIGGATRYLNVRINGTPYKLMLQA